MNITSTANSRKIMSKEFCLEQNFPNPFKKTTNIKFNIPYQTKVSILITNSYGRVVDKLISNSYEAGTYTLEFLADGLPKGTYFYHVIADKYCDSREMELIK